ncbi:ribokinase [Methyloradius palustris]|uniref:Ribokinase n=1 Tax=Methyloradius palustris TaxID=2778876 RepID=A0A8D5G178_9PROT|nr:ribokinase [Methyloradius palustris]
MPVAGETLTASALHIEAGGKGLNVAVGAKRLGAEVDLLLAIGHDVAGDHLLEVLQGEIIDSKHVHRFAENSGHGVGLLDEHGQNMIVIYPGANQLLNSEHVQSAAKALMEADMVYAQLEVNIEAVSAAFVMAKQAGVQTMLNPSPWQPLSTQLLANTDILVVNEVEAVDLLSLTMPLEKVSLEASTAQLQPAIETFWHSWSGSLLVVTLGALGSIAFQRTQAPIQVAAFEVGALDSIGAGDAFASGLCVALNGNQCLKQALTFANACGAIVASKSGVLNALPTAATVATFLESATAVSA